MKTVLERAGLPCARHRLATTRDEARFVRVDVGFPLVAKPQAGAGAKNTFRVDSTRQLEDVLTGMGAGPVLLEEFVTGEEHSFDAVVVDGQPVFTRSAAITRRRSRCCASPGSSGASSCRA
jgi:biotin carboxylase